MAIPPWRPHLSPSLPDRRLLSWLVDPGSLTARCVKSCRDFRVRVLRAGAGQPLADESRLLGIRPGQRAWVREVLLECDGVPVIYAHTVLPVQPRGPLTRWLAGLGSRSLGSLLFSHPGFKRSPLQFGRLDGRHVLFHRAKRQIAAGRVLFLWARRSAHSLGGQSVLVTEVFLPAIRRLDGR